MVKKYLKLHQGVLKMYVIVLNAKELLEISTFEHFDAHQIDGHGYQRPPIPSHYKKITKYFNEDMKAFLPTAILASGRPSDLKEIDSLNISIESKLTIVDGQHRIEGIKNLESVNRDRYEKVLEDYQFPLIIMCLDHDDETTEITAFININKKGKTVSTDLAMQLMNKLNIGHLY